ncbi:MAG: hypothetical protein PF961_08120 [Planctomycetota bacterium]|jgi:uroporphyrinogen decarboxylase|nr:hypothetical protein [Planctomycetota bacterium]
MNPRDAIIQLYRRQGAAAIAPQFDLCPSLHDAYRARYGDGKAYADRFGCALRRMWDTPHCGGPWDTERWYGDQQFKPGTSFDDWGIGHEPGSDAAHHMTRMWHPLAQAELADLELYPFPDWSADPSAAMRDQVTDLHSRGLAACGDMACTVWERAWYLRGMERLVYDFVENPEFANALLDLITARSCRRAAAFAAAGVDVLHLGDDVGTQSRLMMSPVTYRTWLKPRLAAVIAAAKAAKPDIIVRYHSCGYVVELIPDLIEAGVEVLDPIQPESMDVAGLVREFGSELSFNGGLGTQTLMPHGTPQEVRLETHRLLELAGERGGLLPCPTHLLEPEVPWDNIEAYVQACREWNALVLG